MVCWGLIAFLAMAIAFTFNTSMKYTASHLLLEPELYT